MEPTLPPPSSHPRCGSQAHFPASGHTRRREPECMHSGKRAHSQAEAGRGRPKVGNTNLSDPSSPVSLESRLEISLLRCPERGENGIKRIRKSSSFTRLGSQQSNKNNCQEWVWEGMWGVLERLVEEPQKDKWPKKRMLAWRRTGNHWGVCTGAGAAVP